MTIIRILLIFWVCVSMTAFGSVATLTKKTDTAIQESVLKDSFGRDTPRSTVQGFIHALTQNDSTLVAHYLDTSFIKNKNADEFVRDLQVALDKGGRIEPTLNISDVSDGNLVDMLPSDEERIGTIEIGGEELPLLLIKKVNKDNVVYWQFSKKVLEKIPKATQNSSSLMMDIAERFGFAVLQGKRIFGYDVAHMLSLGLILIGSLVMVWLVVVSVYGAVAFLYPKITNKKFAIPPKMILPFSVVVLAYLLSEIMVQAGVPVTLRASVTRGKDVLAWLAMAWLAIRLIDAVFRRAEAISLRRNRPEQVSILTLLRKVAKAFMLIVAVIIIFGNLGFDLTTGIAALGVGGLALAFGAQKTIENLIGSVVVVADRPIHVGDYCRFGTMEGTVIDIGIRSSQIRTLNRTVVTVPNGEFSAMQIENYTARDMFHFLHHLYLARSAKPDELGRMMSELKDFLLNHSHTNHEWTQVRISELRQDCFVVEIRCYITTDDVRMFYDKQSELILDILKQVENYEVQHALPSQNITIENQQDINELNKKRQEPKTNTPT